MIAAFMRLWAFLPTRYPKTVVAACLLLTIAASFFVPRLHVSTDRNLLAGTQSEVFQRRERVAKMFGTSLVSVVVLAGDSPQKVRNGADELAARLARYPEHIKDVFYKADVAFFMRHGLMFAPHDGIDRLVGVLNDKQDLFFLDEVDSLPALLAAAGDYVESSPLPEDATVEDVDNALDQADAVLDDLVEWFTGASLAQPGFITRLLARLGISPQMASSDGYLVDGDGNQPSLAVLFVQPVSDSQEMDVVAPLTDLLRHEAGDVAAVLGGVTPYVTGMPSLATDELRLVTRDCVVAGIVAGLGVVLIFVFAFRSIRVAVFLVLPLGVGMIWSAGFTGLVYGHLTMITSYFAAVLFGLGVAFTIHLVVRFHEALSTRISVDAAVVASLEGAGPGVLVGGLTTALAFAAIVFSDFRGFAEMGVISGVGVLLILLANLTLLPAALVLWHPSRFGDVQRWSRENGRMRFPVWGRWGTLFAAGMFIAGLVALGQVQFDYAVENMLPRDSEAVQGIRLLNERTDYSTTFSVAVAASPAAAAEKARAFEALSTVGRVEHINMFVPPGQTDKMAALAEVSPMVRARIQEMAEALNEAVSSGRSSAQQLGDALSDLGDVLEDVGFDAQRSGRPEADRLGALAKKARAVGQVVREGGDERTRVLEQRVLEMLAGGMSMLAFGLEGAGFGVEDVAPAVRNRYMSGDGARWAVIVYPNGDIGEKSFFYRHVDELLSVDDTVTGHPITHRQFTKMIHRGFLQAVLLSLGAVVLLVVLDLRSVLGIAMALGPVVLSAVWTALAMWLTGLKLNYANIMALPILIGTGVDYGVHLAHRVQQSGSIRVALDTTGRAIVLSGMTTLIGFGSLLLGNHWGVQSLGLLLVTGILFSLVAALLVVPGVMGRGKAAVDTGDRMAPSERKKPI